MPRAHRMLSAPAAALVIAAMGATPAAAQSHSQSRFEISANVDAQAAAKKFTESETFAVNAETETVTAAHRVKTGLGFNVGAAVRIIPGLWVGAAYAMATMKPSASVTAVVPHPLLFNTPRTVQGSVSDVAHDEQNVHVDLMYVLPVRAVDVKVMAGSSIFTVKQDFVSGVRVNETYPFDTATFASASTTRLSKAAVGFNAGVDVSRPVSRRVAVGGLVRYGRGNVKFGGGNVGRQTVRAGGIEAAAGVRIRF